MWKIAIIDDDRNVLEGMKRAIPWEELNSEWAGEALNGEEGLHMIHSHDPDIVITDIYMPVMNGLEMIEKLRERDFHGKVIILSGYSDFEYARQALRLNVSDYLSKPVSIPTLKTILGKVIEELKGEEQRSRQEELEQKLAVYEPFIQKEWVKSAAAGTLDSFYHQEGMLPPAYRFWTEREHVVVGIDVVRDFRASEVSLTDWNLFRFAISNIASEIAGDLFAAFEYTDLHSTRSALVIHPQKGESAEGVQQRLERLGTRLIDCVGGYLKLVIRVGVGTVKEHWPDIPDSTEEAFRAIDLQEERMAPGYELYGSGAAGKSGVQPVRMRPVKFYLELAGAIKSSQLQQAQGIVDDYMRQLEERGDLTPGDLQMLAGELWGILAYTLYETGQVLDDLFGGGQIAKEKAGLTKPGQLAEWLKDKISVICSSRELKGSGKHRKAVEFMVGYIHEHYAEDITLGELADKLLISRNYLAIIFKNVTGEAFNSYLARVRIEKARELLLERNMLVYEVAEKVGYKNVPYFSTLFKKFTGMNPTELVK
ncbi:response regulator transcription factor [Paenibacillus sp. S-38]|uniref:response regulator transcription factor n=1 Tax=Paenibacillus sp. S-38 TaxID=3416710 RepID=UPI003CF83141